MELTDVSIDTIVALTKQLNKQNGMVFTTEDLVLIKVLPQEKRLRQLINNHTVSSQINVNVHESVLSRKLVF